MDGHECPADRVAAAEAEHAALLEQAAAFWERNQLLLTPATCTPPFDRGIRYLSRIGEVKLSSYVEWLRPTSFGLRGVGILRAVVSWSHLSSRLAAGRRMRLWPLCALGGLGWTKLSAPGSYATLGSGTVVSCKRVMPR